MIRSARDFWTGLIYIVFGLSAVLIARNYGMGTALKMGPGYFPTVLGALLTVIGLIALVRSLVTPGAPLGAFAVKGAVLVIGATLLFGFLVRRAGLAVALPLLVMVSAHASAHFRWRASIALAAGLTVFCALVFLLLVLALWP